MHQSQFISFTTENFGKTLVPCNKWMKQRMSELVIKLTKGKTITTKKACEQDAARSSREQASKIWEDGNIKQEIYSIKRGIVVEGKKKSFHYFPTTLMITLHHA